MTQYVQCIFIPRGGTVWYTMMTWCFTHNYCRHKTNKYHQQKLNGFTAEQLLYEMKYKCHYHLMLNVVNKLPVIKLILNMKSLKTIVLRIWLSSWIWADAECTVEVRSDDDAMVKSSAQINPFKFQKVTKYALFYYSVIVLKISREFFAIAAVRDPSVLDIEVRVAKDPNM